MRQVFQVVHVFQAAPHRRRDGCASHATSGDLRVALGGFMPPLGSPDQVRWATSFQNWLQTWDAPLLFRPHLFARGVRLLFGDHAMFFRREDFLAVGGCDAGMTILEEADLRVNMARLGRVRLVNRVILTSDQCVAPWASGARTGTFARSGCVGRSACASVWQESTRVSANGQRDSAASRRCRRSAHHR